MHLTPEEWGFLASLVGSVGTVIGYFGKRTRRVEQATDTLRPNGGSSLNDAIRRIEKAVERLDMKQDSQCDLLADLRGRFEQHLDEVESQKREWQAWRQQSEGRSRRR